MSSPLPILRITDGTTSLNLISTSSGFHLSDWRPAAPAAKDDGVFQSSPFADGRRLAFRRFGNAIETFELKVSGSDQDNAIWYLQELRRLLEKAVSYWTNGWQGGPVWIEARGSLETNLRYATVMDYRALADNNPYAQPFFDCNATVDEFTLVIERGHWQSTKPGLGECVQRSSLQEWQGRYTNILLNGDFETAGAGGADVFANWTEEGATITDDTSVYYHGTHSCKMLRTGSVPAVKQTVTVTASTNYSIHIHHRMSYPEDFPSYAYYAVYDVTHSTYIISPTSLVLTEIWMKTPVSFTTPVGCVSIRIDLIGAQSSLVTVWFDYISLYSATGFMTMGMEETCDADEVYLANHWTNNNLSHVFVYDAQPLALYSSNLLDSALPWTLLPGTAITADDAIYFGIDTNFADYGPFTSLVFDLGTAQTNITSAVWEYYNGSWITLPCRDNTALPGTVPLTNTGIHSVHWAPRSDWTTVAINGITAYWVRLRITAVGGAVTKPVQQNRPIYVVNAPHVDIASDQVSGDIPALMNLGLRNISYVTVGAPVDYIYGVYVSLRSTDRGEDFHEFINFADRLNLDGVTITAGGHSAFANDLYSATGRAIQYDPPGVHVSDWIGKIELDNSVAHNFMGEFHVYARARQNGGSAGDFRLKFVLTVGGTTLYTSEEDYAPIAIGIQVYDLGVIDIGKLFRRYLAGIYTSGLTLYVYASNSNGTPGDLYLHDLVLVPTDEFCAFVSSSVTPLITLGNGNDYVLQLDSLSVPGEEMMAYLNKSTDDTFYTDWKKINVGPVILQANRNQRIFTFMLTDISTMTQAWPDACLVIHKLEKSDRYLSMRGDR